MTWKMMFNQQSFSFEELGITHLRRRRQNLLTDKVTFSIAGDGITADTLLLPNTSVTILKGTTSWFQGVVTQLPMVTSAKEAYLNYELSGPWWYLENIIYQQAWQEYQNASALSAIYKSHIILGQNASGERITIGEQITDIVHYAIQCGAPLALETVTLPVTIPLDECKDLSCAEAIRRLLRWVPDTVAKIDYTTSVPTLSFQRYAQLTSATVDLNTSITSFSIQPRYDLQVPSVLLKFETTHQENQKTWKEVVQQVYPAQATGAEIKALVLTIDLEGGKSNYLIQEIVTETIQVHSIDWWKTHVPALNHVASDHIVIHQVSRQSSLPNELVHGSVAPWMQKETAVDTITADISFYDDNQYIAHQTIAIQIMATNATTGTYKKLSSLLTGETVPDGLAQAMFEALNPLQYEGNFTLVKEECEDDFWGKCLHFSNGRPEWSTMHALVQETTEILDTGTVYVRFGPAQHLGAADLVEMTRSGRSLYVSKNATERTSGEATGNGTVEQGIYHRVDNTTIGTATYKMMKFVDPADTTKTARIFMDDLEQSSLHVQFRQEDVCDSGVLKKRYSLASEPFVLS